MNDNRNGRQDSAAVELDESGVLSWVHFGDLHITEEHEQNYRDFLALVEQANSPLARGVNFAVLPGDNTDDGTEDQYRLVKAAIDRLGIPLYVIPGDRDIKTGSLDLFRTYLEPEPVQSVAAGPYHCIFLNSVDSGVTKRFGLGRDQLTWLRRELEAATRQSRHPILFMHTYPSELGDGTAEVTALVQQRLRAIGPEFASVLTLEAFFRNISNRSQVAAYSGSRPPRGKSGGINRDQGISKAGNPRLRRMMQK